MSKKSEAPLWVDVKQSPNLLRFIIVVHSLALISCLLMSINMALKVVLILLPGYSLYYYLRCYKHGFYTFSLRHTEALSWKLVEGSDYSHLRILKSSVLTPFIIILQVRVAKKPRTLLVCRDAVSAEEYRQLYVALKIMTLE